MSPPLAHSPRKGVSAQTYIDHIKSVQGEAVHKGRGAAAFYSGNREAFVSAVAAAAVYHDLGKLDKLNQAVLQQDSRKPLPIPHEDAGVAELEKLGRQEAVVLVHGHHGGLFSLREQLAMQRRPFRETKRSTPGNERVADHVDRCLAEYECDHTAAGGLALSSVDRSELSKCGFTRRIALSCLVDADHGDTARHYGQEVENASLAPRWTERFAALQRYVDGLPEGDAPRERNRNRLRKRMFEACRDAPLSPSIRTCDAPVGTGKTTAVMAHLLRVAAEREPQLRHIIVVLPYTNIITQSVEVYRRALVLDGERPEDIVAEHHHQADFDDIELRQLATLWKAPIIVTTAVQFFETLGSHHPARLRKLHELPGSAVFVDEMHAAIPSHLWPQMWRWLETWTRDWGGYLLLASGSLPRFWDLREYGEIIRGDDPRPLPAIPDIVADESLRDELKRTEERRIHYQRRPVDASALECDELVGFVIEKPGPRLLVVNTVQTAAVVAQAMRHSGHDVLHLSTAVAPAHRDLIVERIKRRLKDKAKDWTLIATSCVEAGMNFSFRTGFRERASTASLIQVGGRVSREDEFAGAEVWDILLRDDRFRTNPGVEISRRALDHFTLEELNGLPPAELAADAMRREWTEGAREQATQLIKDENAMEYPTVSNESRVIDTDTRMVIIDKSLADAIRNGKEVNRLDIMKHSVQIWANKIEKLALEPVIHGRYSLNTGIYEWKYEYDPTFLGYMEGVLKLDGFILAGGAVV